MNELVVPNYMMRNLIDLSLEWGEIRNILDAELDVKVIPPCRAGGEDVNKLRINAYRGVRCAICMNRAHLIANLEYIQLDECLEWQTLPTFWAVPVPQVFEPS
ncbi:hypothetical protein IEQ34_007868 [Dendrobium chrysotoxum]|uniref:R13L1/DRL21-like LRR repeat region domain-containing protein n=1 Tax=Dendrobium chrysotoxum TaxID=161865 RepID=A0AAV7H2L0_DENCH|nr:hypothetical protein IEQ34_007868 [Dendrobium chrysotoxum]